MCHTSCIAAAAVGQICTRLAVCVRHLSQLKPSTWSLQRHCPVATSHSCVLPEGEQVHGLGGGEKESEFCVCVCVYVCETTRRRSLPTQGMTFVTWTYALNHARLGRPLF